MPAAKVTFSRESRKDIAEIYDFLNNFADDEFVANTINKLYEDIQRVADTPLLGTLVPKLGGGKKRWLIVDRRYWLIFKRRKNGIRVVRVWSTRRPFLQ
jgi:plasmid stabilization system protein ParE